MENQIIQQISTNKQNLNNNEDQQYSFIQQSKSIKQQNNNKWKKINKKYVMMLFGVILVILILFQLFQLIQNDSQSSNKQLQYSSINKQPSLQQQQQQQFEITLQKKTQPTPESFAQNNNFVINNKITPYIAYIASPQLDKYFFSIPISQIILQSHLASYFVRNNKKNLNGLNYDSLQMSVRLLQLNHNIDLDGNIKVKLAQYDNNDIKTKQSRLIQLIKKQSDYFQSKYSTHQYLKTQLPFCIVIPSYNNIHSKLYLRNLDSIFMQEYDNYHIVYIDDASPQHTGQYVKKYIQDNNIPNQFIKIIINNQNKLALSNIYYAIHKECNPGEIVALIDGDDALIGRQVLAVYNAVYQKTKSALVYSNYLHIVQNKYALLGSSSKPIPIQYLTSQQSQNSFRKNKDFSTSHLLTFYSDLFKKINISDLTYQNGTFFQSAYDVSMTTPMIQMARKRIFFISQPMYQYRYDTGQNDQANQQQKVSEIVFNKKQYQELKQFQWIDNRQQYLNNIKKQINNNNNSNQ